jgi:hypothetical protein
MAAHHHSGGHHRGDGHYVTMNIVNGSGGGGGGPTHWLSTLGTLIVLLAIAAGLAVLAVYLTCDLPGARPAWMPLPGYCSATPGSGGATGAAGAAAGAAASTCKADSECGFLQGCTDGSCGVKSYVWQLAVAAALFFAAMSAYAAHRDRRNGAEDDEDDGTSNSLLDDVQFEAGKLRSESIEASDMFISAAQAVAKDKTLSDDAKASALQDLADAIKVARATPGFDANAAADALGGLSLGSVAESYLAASAVNKWGRTAFDKVVFAAGESGADFDSKMGPLQDAIDKVAAANPQLNRDAIKQSLVSAFEAVKTRKVPDVDYEKDTEMKEIFDEMTEHTKKLRKNKYQSVASSIGKLLQGQIERAGVGNPVKATLVSATPGIGKSQSVTNWAIKHPEGLIINVSRGTIGTSDIAGAEAKFKKMVGLARALTAQDTPVMMVFEEAQDTVGEPLFQPMILNYTENAPFSIIATTNRSDVFKGAAAGAIASRFGEMKIFKLPRMTGAQKTNVFMSFVGVVENEHGVKFAIPRDITRGLEGKWVRNFDTTGYRIFQNLDNMLRHLAKDPDAERDAEDRIIVKLQGQLAPASRLDRLKRAARGVRGV